MTHGDGWLPAVRLHQLEGFFYVATHEGFTRAAEAMPYPITEPALHQQVRKLERALGARLLERGPKRRMLLTPAGRALFEHVAPYFQTLPGVLRAVASGEAGVLLVASEPLFVEPLAAPLLAALQAEAPAGRLRLVELDLLDAPTALLEGQVDVALVGALARLPAGVTFEQLGTLGLELRVPAAHPLAKKRAPLSPRQLAGLRCVVYTQGSAGRAFGEAVLAAAGVEVTPAAEASTASAMQALVRAGVAPAFVPSLRDGAQRPRKRTLADGTVAFDLTESAQTIADLPRYGLLRRSRPAPQGLLARFCELARARA